MTGDFFRYIPFSMIENEIVSRSYQPELLLPVGQKEMALAAIHHGADAIFVGMPGFNARGRSHDFEVAELKEMIDLCHLYGVKVNLAFNILIFENELPLALESLLKILPLKPDAFIVQDIGLIKLIRTLTAEQVIHGSTQMTVTNELAISLLNDLNIKRFVLARENSLQEIRLIKERTEKELEVFVHGALCVSYSGQCFTSETLGGRSANRGQCAQSCRFGYELYVDGQKKDLVEKEFLVSPQDLCSVSDMPELLKIGVNSFKIEGRLKTPDYVATATDSYRMAIDRYFAGNPLNNIEVAQQKQSMSTTYSRGFFNGWMDGVNHQKLVNGTSNSHRGLKIGKIAKVLKNGLEIELDENLLPSNDGENLITNGDGLLWYFGMPKNKTGSFIYSVENVSKKVIRVGVAKETFLHPDMAGSEIYLNHDQSQRNQLQKVLSDKNLYKKIPLKLDVALEIGEPLKVTLSDGRFHLTEISESVLQKSINNKLTSEKLEEELGALGATCFKLDSAHFQWNSSEKELFLNHKEIKQIRQRLIGRLTTLRESHTVDGFEITLREQEVASLLSQPILEPIVSKPKFHVLLRNRDQVSAILRSFVSGELKKEAISLVTLDFEFGRDYQESVQNLKAAGIKVGVATTRILKPQEYLNLKILKSLNPDFILARNLGAVEYFKSVNPTDIPLIGDFSLNVTNHLTAEYLLSKGLESVCISYDLNFDQSVALLKASPAQNLEVTIHQAMPSFHMEHCVFAAFLSTGTSYKDCGRPCEKHLVQLKDQFGNQHWIKPDQECRNTMYNAKSQTAVRYLPEWMQQGIGTVRFEALHESPIELITKLQAYTQFLEGGISVEQVLENVKAVESYGLSAGPMGRTVEYKSKKKDLGNTGA